MLEGVVLDEDVIDTDGRAAEKSTSYSGMSIELLFVRQSSPPFIVLAPILPAATAVSERARRLKSGTPSFPRISSST